MPSTKHIFVTTLAMCYALTNVAQARPGYQHGGSSQTQLVGVPDFSSFGHLHYPQLDIIDLGSSAQGHLPATEIKVIKTITLKEPYPVKVPHKVPYPVHIPKPYPVPVTKVVKVPQPVPYEVVKNVPVHVEVPKPYPVPVSEYHGNQGFGGGGHSSQPYGAASSNVGGETTHYHYDTYKTIQNYAQGEDADVSAGAGGSSQGHYDASYENNGSGEDQQQQHGHEDRSNVYVAVTSADAVHAQPNAAGYNQQQQDGSQQQEQH